MTYRTRLLTVDEMSHELAQILCQLTANTNVQKYSTDNLLGFKLVPITKDSVVDVDYVDKPA